MIVEIKSRWYYDTVSSNISNCNNWMSIDISNR